MRVTRVVREENKMNDKQFDKLLKAVTEISNILVVGIIGLAILIAVIGMALINLL